MSKHVLALFIFFFAAATSGCDIALIIIQQDHPVNQECTVFHDQNLHNAVCGIFEMQDDCEISCDDERFQSTDGIILDHLEIRDITGIEKFENLVYLDLSVNQIQDISPISDLINLEALWLEDNQIEDISPISHLLNLRSLKLGLNQIQDISPISDLINLEYLSLYNNKIQDISPISDLVNLVQVSLANNEEIVDLRPLANMQDLTFVAVQGIPSAHSPENCQVLNGLVDRGVEVDGFDPERCPEVVVGCTVTFPDQNLHNAVCEHLEMQDSCEISCDDPMFLSTTRINLSSLGIQDISGIERFGNLNELRLSYNQITNISPVSGLVNLTTLFMNGNQIDNISPIFGLVDLEMLVLTDNRVVDISSIANLTNLSYLGISDNQVVDISPLSHLVGLEHLSLATNYGILDFRPVGQIPNLLYFSVYNIQSAYTAENCQVLNGLVDRGVEVYGFDSEECLPEPVIIHTSLNPQHFNQQELFNGTNTLISFIISSLDEDLEILSIEVEVIQSLARVDQEIELWDDEQFMSFAHLRETQNESVFSSIFFTDDVQLLVSEVGSHLDIQGDVFGVVAGSAVVTCLRSITYRSLDYGEEQSIDFDREMCQTLSH